MIESVSRRGIMCHGSEVMRAGEKDKADKGLEGSGDDAGVWGRSFLQLDRQDTPDSF